jgi:hypothetical protein
LKGSRTRAIAIPEQGQPLIGYDELLGGVGLILGAFVGLAAFGGALMSWNYIMAGSAGTNGVLFSLPILLLAWKIAGYIGLDYGLLPLLGAPWKSERRSSAAASGLRATAEATSSRSSDGVVLLQRMI